MTIIATPMGYVMEAIYGFTQNYGLSVILFALLAKIIMLPLSIKQKRSMISMQRINPKLKELQKKYGNNQEKYNQEVMKLYEEENVSPMGGCGTMLLTFPIMIGLYYVVTQPLTYFMHVPAEAIAEMAKLFEIETNYGYQLQICGQFAQNFDQLKAISDAIYPVDFTFLGLDLTLTPNFKEFSALWIIPILSAATAWMTSQVTNRLNKQVSGQASSEDEKTEQMNKSMTMMMPLMSGYFGFVLPAAVGIYWIANNLFTCVQEVILTNYCMKQGENNNNELTNKTGGKKVK